MSVKAASKLILLPNFISETKAQFLVQKIDQKMKRIMNSYQEGHFDRVIKGYKECQASNFDPNYSGVDANTKVQDIVRDMQREIVNRVPESAFETNQFIPPHILDLRDGNSGIGPHIDYLNASGGIIAGLSLISPAVFVFKKGNESFRALVPPNSLYIQFDELRYEWTHEIPMTNDPDHHVNGQFIERGRRLVMLLRDKKKMVI